MKKHFAVTVLCSNLFFTPLAIADYASEYRELYAQWQAADKAFKAYTQDKQPQVASQELLEQKMQAMKAFMSAKREHPALQVINEQLAEAEKRLEEAIRAKEVDKRKAVLAEMVELQHQQTQEAVKVPDLKALKDKWDGLARQERDSAWRHDPEADALYQKAQKLRQDLADLHASQVQTKE